MPLSIRWPKGIAPGKRCDVPVHFADFFPTFCDLAGVEVDPGHKLDGMNLKPLFSGGTLPERSIFLHYPHYLSYYGATPVRRHSEPLQARVASLRPHCDRRGSPGRADPEVCRRASRRAVRSPSRSRRAPEPRGTASGKGRGDCASLFEAWMKETGAKDVTPNPAYDPKNPLFNARDDYLKKQAEKKK